MKFSYIPFIIGLALTLLAIFYFPLQEMVSTAKANSLETGCKTIGTIGSVIVARCYDDETGAIFYGNSNGWMSNPLE